jgi:hypothetical protein
MWYAIYILEVKIKEGQLLVKYSEANRSVLSIK